MSTCPCVFRWPCLLLGCSGASALTLTFLCVGAGIVLEHMRKMEEQEEKRKKMEEQEEKRKMEEMGFTSKVQLDAWKEEKKSLDAICSGQVKDQSVEDLEVNLQRVISKMDSIVLTEGLDEKIEAAKKEVERLETIKVEETVGRKILQCLSERANLLTSEIDKYKVALRRSNGLYADALEEANAVIDEDTLRYNTAYTKYLRCDPQAAEGQDSLETTIRAYASSSSLNSSDEICWKMEGATFLQPDEGGLMNIDGLSDEEKASRREEYANGIRNALLPVVEKLDTVFKAMASEIPGVEYLRGPPKKNDRLFQKARLSYKGNVRRITDFERCSFVCVDFPTMIVIFNALTKVVKKVRIKNRFSKNNKEGTESGGYRDLQTVVLLQGDLLLEIQIHLALFYKLKTEVAGDTDARGQTGHQRYIQFRQLKEKAEFVRQNFLSEKRN